MRRSKVNMIKKIIKNLKEVRECLNKIAEIAFYQVPVHGRFYLKILKI